MVAVICMFDLVVLSLFTLQIRSFFFIFSAYLKWTIRVHEANNKKGSLARLFVRVLMSSGVPSYPIANLGRIS